MPSTFLACLDIFPSIFLWKKPLPFKFLASALILYGDTYMGLEGNDFEDVIRTAVSLGGDCDTLTCIAGGMAEAFYGVPEFLKEKCLEFTTKDMHEVMESFEKGKG